MPENVFFFVIQYVEMPFVRLKRSEGLPVKGEESDYWDKNLGGGGQTIRPDIRLLGLTPYSKFKSWVN